MSTDNKLVMSIAQAIVDLDGDQAVALTQQAIDSHIPAKDILAQGLVAGLNTIGEMWNRLEVFLPEVMMAVDAMNHAMALLRPQLETQAAAEGGGTGQVRVVIATVKGDLHDIGKNIVAAIMTASGFEVHDLGVDQSATAFLDKARAVKAQIIAMSSLMTTTMNHEKDLIELLVNVGERNRYIVLCGGGPTTPEWAASIGADGWASNAYDAVNKAKELVAARH
jgi:corrinoid protein of di/trimethylamine methyltransferase